MTLREDVKALITDLGNGKISFSLFFDTVLKLVKDDKE